MAAAGKRFVELEASIIGRWHLQDCWTLKVLVSSKVGTVSVGLGSKLGTVRDSWRWRQAQSSAGICRTAGSVVN